MKRLTTKEFIDKANHVHNSCYHYDKTVYLGQRTKVCVICKHHGEFWQNPSNHLYGFGCKQCGNNRIAASKKDSMESFIRKAEKVHNNKYRYMGSFYKNAHTKIEIQCPNHGTWWQTPNDHLSGYGCPVCKSSKGELLIKSILDSNDIRYSRQFRIANCKRKRTLPFDFAIFNSEHVLRGLIEFNGEQHYRPKFSTMEFKNTQESDNIKRKYCIAENLPLLVVSHDNPNIDDTIKKFIKKVI